MPSAERIARIALALILLLACHRAAEKRPAAPAQTIAPPARPKPLEGKTPEPPEAEPIARDLPEIRDAKTLRVLFTFNSTGYLMYRGQTMGYEYELLSRCASDNDLRLVPVVVRDSSTLFDRLNAGDGDVVAAQLVSSPNGARCTSRAPPLIAASSSSSTTASARTSMWWRSTSPPIR